MLMSKTPHTSNKSLSPYLVSCDNTRYSPQHMLLAIICQMSFRRISTSMINTDMSQICNRCAWTDSHVSQMQTTDATPGIEWRGTYDWPHERSCTFGNSAARGEIGMETQSQLRSKPLHTTNEQLKLTS